MRSGIVCIEPLRVNALSVEKFLDYCKGFITKVRILLCIFAPRFAVFLQQCVSDTWKNNL